MALKREEANDRSLSAAEWYAPLLYNGAQCTKVYARKSSSLFAISAYRSKITYRSELQLIGRP